MSPCGRARLRIDTSVSAARRHPHGRGWSGWAMIPRLPAAWYNRTHSKSVTSHRQERGMTLTARPGPLLTKEQMERYSRQTILEEVGLQGQRKLLDSKVLVVGAGGLGS